MVKILWYPIEKIFWIADFTYRDAFCTIMHRKFGFKLYITNELTKDRADEIAKSLLEELNGIISELDKVTE